MLGDAEQLKAEYMLAEQDNLIDEGEVFGSGELTVRIRYRSKPIPCSVKRLEDGRLLVHLRRKHLPLRPDNQLYSISEKGGRRFVHCFTTWYRHVYLKIKN